MVRRGLSPIALSAKIESPLTPITCPPSEVVDPRLVASCAIAFLVRRLNVLSKECILWMILNGDPVVGFVAVVRR